MLLYVTLLVNVQLMVEYYFATLLHFVVQFRMQDSAKVWLTYKHADIHNTPSCKIKLYMVLQELKSQKGRHSRQ